MQRGRKDMADNRKRIWAISYAQLSIMTLVAVVLAVALVPRAGLKGVLFASLFRRTVNTICSPIYLLYDQTQEGQD